MLLLIELMICLKLLKSMVNDKEQVKKAFDRFLIQQAREQECYEDEVAVVVYDHLRDTRYF